MYIKSIFKEIIKKKLNSLLFIIQLVFTIITIINCIGNIKMIDYPREQVKFVLDNKYKDFYKVDIKNKNGSQDFLENFLKFDSKLKQVLGVDNVGAFDLTNTAFIQLEENETFKNKRKELTKGTFKELHPDAIEQYMVDYAIYKLMKFKIVTGRGLEKQDFEMQDKKEIPMIVSNVYMGIINIGDVLTSRLDNKNYKVVGFFDKEIRWFSDQDPVSLNLVNLNDKVISPYLVDKTALNMEIKSQQYYFIKNNQYPISTIKNNIIFLGRGLNFNIELESLDKKVSQAINEKKEVVFYDIFVSVFVIIISCFGLSVIMYYSVNLRKREFGIRIMCGGNIKHIKKLIVGEIFTLVLISSSLAYLIMIIISINNKTIDYDIITKNTFNIFDIKAIILIVAFILLFTLISALLPLKRLSKLTPKELIGGIE